MQLNLERPVAIKLLPPELGASAEFRERFRREAKAMAQLNHPHIVPGLAKPSKKHLKSLVLMSAKMCIIPLLLTCH